MSPIRLFTFNNLSESTFIFDIFCVRASGVVLMDKLTILHTCRRLNPSPQILSPDFSPRVWKGGASQAADKRLNAVILSAAKDPCI